MMQKKTQSTYCPKKVLCCDLDIGDRFTILEKIGQGSFGDIYKAYDTQKNQLCAVKLERKDKKGPNGMILKEAQVLQILKNNENFPKFIYLQQSEDFNYIIMSFLGQNMESLKRKQTDFAFSLQTVLLCAIQMVYSLEVLHEKQYVHRDIKPENYVVGNEGNHHTVYLIDFGLSKKYQDETGHIPFVENKGLVGTARYTSINSHLGIEQSRRDDLESLGYVLLYFAKGTLPWQNLQCENKTDNTSIEELCSNLPDLFQSYFNHVKNLQFYDRPDYEFLKKLFFDHIKQNFIPSNNNNNNSIFSYEQQSLYFNSSRTSINQKFLNNNNRILSFKENNTPASQSSHYNTPFSNNTNLFSEQTSKLCFDWCSKNCENELNPMLGCEIWYQQQQQQQQKILPQQQTQPSQVTDFLLEQTEEKKLGEKIISIPNLNILDNFNSEKVRVSSDFFFAVPQDCNTNRCQNYNNNLLPQSSSPLNSLQNNYILTSRNLNQNKQNPVNEHNQSDKQLINKQNILKSNQSQFSNEWTNQYDENVIIKQIFSSPLNLFDKRAKEKSNNQQQ